jgi:hypothetical protein
MKLENLLAEKRSAIIKKWRNAIIETYPDETQRFIRKEKDRFSNPVGLIIEKEIETLYDEVTGAGDREKIASCLDNIIRVRAVQDFIPSQAIAFVLQLKSLVREEVKEKGLENGQASELEALENRIDDMVLQAFDIYSQCRKKIYEIRVNEVRNQVGKLLERANLTCEIPEVAPGFRHDK